MAQVYVSSITRSTMYLKAPFCSVACGFSSFKIDYSNYLKSLINRIYEVCVNMVSVTSSYHPSFQSRSLMFIRGLFPQNWPRQFRLDNDHVELSECLS